MKKAIIYVFSGTGNTFIAAKKIAKSLETRGYTADVWRVHVPFSDAPDPRGYDLAGFGYPIHAFNAPQFILRFARSLPAVEELPAFIFKTSGEPFSPNNASSFNLNAILRRKGFRPVSDTHLLMPYNIMFRYKDALAKQMYAHTSMMAEHIADDAANGRGKRLRYNPLTIGFALALRLQWLGAWLNGPLIHTKKDLCTGCGRCVRECPTNNITLKDKKPCFGWKCTMCMGCVMGCPADAVRPGFLNPWRVNGKYDFEKIANDETIPAEYVNDDTKGYFRLFRGYYTRTRNK